MNSMKGGDDTGNKTSMSLAYGMIGMSLLTALLVLLWMVVRGH
ncbi:hypothetical protein [Streptomyces malaysiense]|nr:hypothetical protein [Streptomyces malaysiense]